jgi:hypothetical protein
MAQTWVLRVRLAFTTGIRPDMRAVSDDVSLCNRRRCFNFLEMKPRSGYKYPATLSFQGLAFSFPPSFTFRTASLALTLSRNLYSLSRE